MEGIGRVKQGARAYRRRTVALALNASPHLAISVEGKGIVMSGDSRLEQMFEQYQRQHSMLTDLHQKMKEISVTATSPRREVEITVNHGGSVTDIAFTGSAYKRMAPKELAEVIMRTLEDAKDKAADESARLLEPVMPNGMNARDLLAGRLGIEQLAPADGPRLPQIVREELQR